MHTNSTFISVPRHLLAVDRGLSVKDRIRVSEESLPGYPEALRRGRGEESRLQDVPVAEGAFQGGLHLHVAELADGEVQMLQRQGPLVGVVV